MNKRPAPDFCDSGLTLVEVLVALTIFASVSVGAFGVLGAVTAGGLPDGASTALGTARQAKEITVAVTYLQSLHDHLAALDAAAWAAMIALWPPGAAAQAYCVAPGRLPCSGIDPPLPAPAGPYPLPEPRPHQLEWITLVLTLERWSWDCSGKRFAPAAITTEDFLVRVRSELTWQSRGRIRTLVAGGPDLERSVSAGGATPPALDEACP